MAIDKAIDAGRLKYNELSKATRKEEQPEYTHEQEEEARKIWEKGRMLEFLVESCHAEHVGDDRNIRILLLSAAGINVKNSDGIHISVTGAAGTGKSHVAKTVCNHLPQSRVIYGGLSDKTLLYHPIQDGTIIIMDDEDMSDTLWGVMKQATTAWNKPAEYRTVIDRHDKILYTPARSSWWIIKAKANKTGDEQVLDRQISLWADESPQQHAAIIGKILQMAADPTPDQRSYGVARALWGCLPTATVAIPYTDNIGMSQKIDPRNLNLFINLIKAHAIIHAPIRETDENGYILSNRVDFEAIRDLMNPLFRGKGGSQQLKLSMDEDRVLKFLAKKPTGDIPYGDIISGTGLPQNRLTYALKGRSDKSHNSDGLLAICPAIEIITNVTEDDPNSTGRRASRKAVNWNKAEYDRWIATASSGFYWIDNPTSTTSFCT